MFAVVEPCMPTRVDLIVDVTCVDVFTGPETLKEGGATEGTRVEVAKT